MPKDLKKINKELRREALRDELQAREYLRQIEEVSIEVSEHWKTLDSNQVGALRLKADLNFKRLNKVLPDVKAIEIEDNTERNYVISGEPITEDEWTERYGLEPTSGATESTH